MHFKRSGWWFFEVKVPIFKIKGVLFKIMIWHFFQYRRYFLEIKVNFSRSPSPLYHDFYLFPFFDRAPIIKAQDKKRSLPKIKKTQSSRSISKFLSEHLFLNFWTLFTKDHDNTLSNSCKKSTQNHNNPFKSLAPPLP